MRTAIRPRVLLLAVMAAILPALPGFALEKASDFNLLDYNGRVHQLRRTDGRAVVLFFTANGCPVARKSVAKLRELKQQFGEDVTVWMVNSESQADPESVRKEAAELDAGSIPILLDDKQELALALGIERTGEAVALSTSDWSIVYRGAIDDQLAEGAEKPQPTRQYLQAALSALFAGEKIANPRTTAKGCLIAFEKVSGERDGRISYVKQVAPILREKCAACHSDGNIGPFEFSSYKVVKGKARMIQEVLLTQRMPPWHADPHRGKFANEMGLTAAEAQTLFRWIEQGAPKDEGADPLAEPIPSPGEWPLGKPDYIVKLPQQQIPATGVLRYRHVKIDSPIGEDVWLGAVMVKPGNPKVLHHIIAYAKFAGSGNDLGGSGVKVGAWVPGRLPGRLPSDTGLFMGRNAKLDIEIHYTTNGAPQTDETEIGFYVLPEKPKFAFKTGMALSLAFAIRPNDPDSRTSSTFQFRRDSILYTLTPHMHVRGSWMKFEAFYPDGKSEVLLSVPRYDFNWQTTYRLSTPKHIPAGTKIVCDGGFDNSSKNPSNPDPNKRVTWGKQSWDEMFIGYIGHAEIPQEASVGPTAAR